MPSIQSEKGPLRPVTSVYVLHKIGLNVRALQVFTFVLKVSHCETKCDKLKLNNLKCFLWTMKCVCLWIRKRFTSFLTLTKQKELFWVILIRLLRRKLPQCKLLFHWHFLFSNETNNTSFQVRIYGNVELCHIVVWML